MKTDAEYKALLVDTLEQLITLTQQRDALELQITKLEEFFRVTANMLSEAERDKFIKKVDDLSRKDDIRTASLTEAIRTVLKSAGRKYLTVAEVRDQLVKSCFDFSEYTSNPLASISTTLRRMKEDEVDVGQIQGVTAYRWHKESEQRRLERDRRD